MTARDLQVIEFVNDFKVARTSVIAKLFYGGNLRVAQRRLQAIFEERKISRVKDREYIYYTKTPQQYKHSIAITDYLAYLSRTHQIGDFRAEYKCGEVRADALVAVDEKPAFIEVQLSGHPDIKKYLSLQVSKVWQKEFDVFPPIYLLANCKPINRGVLVYVDSPLSIR